MFPCTACVIVTYQLKACLLCYIDLSLSEWGIYNVSQLRILCIYVYDMILLYRGLVLSDTRKNCSTHRTSLSVRRHRWCILWDWRQYYSVCLHLWTRYLHRFSWTTTSV